MTSKEVCNLLGITKVTLYRYCSTVNAAGEEIVPKIRRTYISRKKYVYEDDDVYGLMGRRFKQDSRVVIYGRVSQGRAAVDLAVQLSRVRTWAVKNGYKVDATYSDVCPGYNWERSRRKGLHEILRDVFNKRVETVIIESPDRLGPGGREVIEHMFRYSGTHLIVIQDSPFGEVERNDTVRDLSHAIRDMRDSIIVPN